MKIIFLMNHIIMGGLEKVLLEYLTCLNTLGYDIVVMSRDKVTDDFFLKFFKQQKITLIDTVFTGNNSHFFLNKIIKKFIQNARLKNMFKSADCIIDFANFSFYKELKRIRKHKTAFCHGSILFFNSVIDKSVLDIYDDIVCLSDSFKKEFLKQYPKYSNKIHCIYNPINQTNVVELSKRNINVKHPYFVAVQRLDSVDKDVPTVINAFNVFSKTHAEYYLYIVGDGPQMNELKQMAHTNKHIIFTGKVDNPYPYIKNSRALILSSTKTIGEGLPNTLLEAQSLGTLAISSNVPSGPHEILLDGLAGMLFKPGDYKTLAKILMNVADEKKDVTKMIKVATENLSRFSVKNNVNKLLNLIGGKQ